MSEKVEIDKKRKIRAGHRINEQCKSKIRRWKRIHLEDKQWTKQSLENLKEKVAMFKELDSQLIELNQRGLKPS